jgi:hypothetical protein
MPETVWRFFVFLCRVAFAGSLEMAVRPMCVENFAKVFDG